MSSKAQNLLKEFTKLGTIDTNCYLGQWPYRLSSHSTPADLHRYASDHGIQSLWFSHIASIFGFDTRTGNDACIEGMGEHTLAFAVINPKDFSWRQELAWAAESGFAGIRIFPGYHDYPLSEAIELSQSCATHGLLPQLVVRLDDWRVRHRQSPAHDLTPASVADFLQEVEPAPLIVSGMNLLEIDELFRLLGTDSPEGLLLDAWHANGPTGLADTFGSHLSRWVFGSGFPIQAPEPTMLQLAASSLNVQQLKQITSLNAKSALSAARRADPL